MFCLIIYHPIGALDLHPFSQSNPFAMEEKPALDPSAKTGTPDRSIDDNVEVGEVLNASGHKQELDRQFSLVSICAIGITTGE